MDLESLKAILTTVNGVSGDAKTVAILWLGLECVKSVAFWASLASIFWFIGTQIIGAIKETSGLGEDYYTRMKLRHKLYEAVSGKKMTYPEADAIVKMLGIE